MRVLVFANGGSGKSTFARHLAVKHALPILDLDAVVWSPARYAVFRPDAEIFHDLSTFARANESWVVENHMAVAWSNLNFFEGNPSQISHG